MVSKKVLIGCVIAVFVCLALAIACAIIKSFDVVSSIMLGVVIVMAVAVVIISWRELVNQKNNKN